MELGKLFPIILEDASPRPDDTSLADRIELFGFVDLGSLRLAAYRYKVLGAVRILGDMEWLPESEFKGQFRCYERVSE